MRGPIFTTAAAPPDLLPPFLWGVTWEQVFFAAGIVVIVLVWLIGRYTRGRYD